MYLILSTLLHLLSAIPLLPYAAAYGYIEVICVSTTMSIIYHLDESNRVIAFLDYSYAFIWFLYDIYMTYSTPFLYQIILVNGCSCMIHAYPATNYNRFHTIWHIINATKCIYVSLLLKDIIK
jgi:hypothetical protein